MRMRRTAVALVAFGTIFMGLRTAHAYVTSPWARYVVPLGSPLVIADVKKIHSGSVDIAVGYFCDDWGIFENPNLTCWTAAPGDTQIRSRLRCYETSNFTGPYTTKTSLWASNGVLAALAIAECPSSRPYGTKLQVQVRSNTYSSYYWYDE